MNAKHFNCVFIRPETNSFIKIVIYTITIRSLGNQFYERLIPDLRNARNVATLIANNYEVNRIPSQDILNTKPRKSTLSHRAVLA